MTPRELALLTLVQALDGVRDGVPGRGGVTGLEHSCQTATLAHVAGADSELCAVALVHDAFHVLAPRDHGPALALALSDVVSVDRVQVLTYHTDWQHDAVHGTNVSARWASAPWYDDACALGAWDAAAFAPGALTLPWSVLWRPVHDLLQN